jgi:transposase
VFWMLVVETIAKIRRLSLVQGKSIKAICRELGISRKVVRTGARLIFLPPYSPDFNPIENAFSKLKALMRAKAERTITALWNAVGSLVDLFTPAECQNYFKAAGYDPDLTGRALGRFSTSDHNQARSLL